MIVSFHQYLRTLSPAILCCLLLLSSCTELLEKNYRYDSNVLNVQVLSLFNQRQETKKMGGESWRGDWIFRRQRLTLVDSGLFEARPDILILQESMSRKESPQDSDKSILMDGVLQGYEWKGLGVKEYLDSFESESIVFAAARPLKIQDSTRLWPLSTSSFLGVASLSIDGQTITVFNIQVSPLQGEGEDDVVLLDKIADIVSSYIQEKGRCMERVLLGGTLPFDHESSEFRAFKRKLSLKDASTGFCSAPGSCDTASDENELFESLGTRNSLPQQPDKLFVHESAILLRGVRNFTASSLPSLSYYKKYGFKKGLWPSYHYGWLSSLKLVMCGKKR
ncbi:MAG: hypothetical protein KA436_10605 [Oligoflexales bacterium]|nr:hypothetical protein [Oligoflexales bacterium]